MYIRRQIEVLPGYMVFNMVPNLQHGLKAAVIQRSLRAIPSAMTIETDTENRVQLADDLVDGEQRRQEIVDQNHTVQNCTSGPPAVNKDQPRQAYHKQRLPSPAELLRRSQDHRHDRFQVFTHDLRDGRAVVAPGKHAGEVIVDAAGENGAQHNPDVRPRPPQRSAERAENGGQDPRCSIAEPEMPGWWTWAQSPNCPPWRRQGSAGCPGGIPAPQSCRKEITGNQQYKSSKKRYHIPDLLRGIAGYPPAYTQYYLSSILPRLQNRNTFWHF